MNCIIEIISIALYGCTEIISVIVKTVRLIPIWTDPRNLLLFEIESDQRLHFSLIWRLCYLIVDVACDSTEKHFDDCASSSMVVYRASFTYKEIIDHLSQTNSDLNGKSDLFRITERLEIYRLFYKSFNFHFVSDTQICSNYRTIRTVEPYSSMRIALDSKHVDGK